MHAHGLATLQLFFNVVVLWSNSITGNSVTWKSVCSDNIVASFLVRILDGLSWSVLCGSDKETQGAFVQLST